MTLRAVPATPRYSQSLVAAGHIAHARFAPPIGCLTPNRAATHPNLPSQHLLQALIAPTISVDPSLAEPALRGQRKPNPHSARG